MNIIKFNCSGQIFEISKDSIMKLPNSMLAARITSKMDETVTVRSGSYFLDRDPEIFTLILDYYRYGELYIPYNIPYAKVIADVLFYGLDIDDKDISVQNMNEKWKNNNSVILKIERIADYIINSSWFSNKISNSLSFTWYFVTKAKKSITEPDFIQYLDIFKFPHSRDIFIKYIKVTYNLEAEWNNPNILSKSFKKTLVMIKPDGTICEILADSILFNKFVYYVQSVVFTVQY